MIKFIFLMIFTFSCSSAQYKFDRDKTYKPFRKEFENSERLEKTNWDSIKFEFRFWTLDLSNYKYQMYQFRCDNHDQWTLIYYQFCTKIASSFKKDKLKLSNLWGSQFDSLLSLGILKLKDQKLVEKKWKFAQGFPPLIGDGTIYSIDLITKTRRRAYDYTNPESLIEDLDVSQYLSIEYPNGNELVRFNKMLEILNHQIDFYHNLVDFDCDKYP